MPCLTKIANERVIVPMGHVVEILHTHDLGNFLCLQQLLGSYFAQSEVTNQPLTFEFGQRRQRFLDRLLRRFHNSANSKVDHIERAKAEILEVVMNGVGKLLTRESMNPGLI